MDIGAVTRVRPEPLRELQFVLDVHLGRLAAYLRLAGFDTVYRNNLDDAELAWIAAGGRVLLTHDRELLKRRAVTRGELAPCQLASRAVGGGAPPIRPVAGGPAILPVSPMQCPGAPDPQGGRRQGAAASDSPVLRRVLSMPWMRSDLLAGWSLRCTPSATGARDE